MLVIVVGYTSLVPRKGEPGGEKLREYTLPSATSP